MPRLPSSKRFRPYGRRLAHPGRGPHGSALWPLIRVGVAQAASLLTYDDRHGDRSHYEHRDRNEDDQEPFDKRVQVRLSLPLHEFTARTKYKEQVRNPSRGSGRSRKLLRG